MWGTMQKLVEIIWKTLGAVAYLTIVLFLILYIFAVIGKMDKICRDVRPHKYPVHMSIIRRL